MEQPEGYADADEAGDDEPDLADMSNEDLARIEVLGVLMKDAANPNTKTTGHDVLEAVYGDELIVPD